MNKRVRHTLSALALAFTAMVVMPAPARACDCGSTPPLKKAVKEADAVFSGITVRGEFPNEVQAINDTLGKVRWTFLVVESAKGEDDLFIEVASHSQGTACGIQFAIGGRYQVFAYENRGDLETNSCTRTTASFEALKIDGARPIAPLNPPKDTSSTDGSRSSPMWAALLAVPLAAAVTVVIVRRRRDADQTT